MSWKITTKSENGKTEIFTPYNSGFVSKIKNLGGKWNGSAWVIDERNLNAARDLCRRIYGEDDLTAIPDRVSVKITLPDGDSKEHDGIYYFGRLVAKAWGRDSGAKLGEDVAFLSGRARSGGSAKWWSTVIEEGSILVMHEVPRRLVLDYFDNPDKPDYYKVEVIETEKNLSREELREVLEDEKKMLLERLNEIESQINKLS